MNILVVEDHPIDRKLVCVVLKTGGHVVREEVSAEDAIQSIAAGHPDIVLLDLRLPGMTGLDLARQLRRNPTTAAIPIVMVTAYPSLFCREEALEAGCDAYLVKPIDTRTIGKTVLEVVTAKAKAR